MLSIRILTMSSAFFILIAGMFLKFSPLDACGAVMPIVTKERLVFYRERAASYYAPRMLSVAQGVAEVPYLAVQSLIMVIVTYWMVGFIVSAWRFFYFLLLFFLTVTM